VAGFTIGPIRPICPIRPFRLLLTPENTPKHGETRLNTPKHAKHAEKMHKRKNPPKTGMRPVVNGQD
jgi:hypothetical protein